MLDITIRDATVDDHIALHQLNQASLPNVNSVSWVIRIQGSRTTGHRRREKAGVSTDPIHRDI